MNYWIWNLGSSGRFSQLLKPQNRATEQSVEEEKESSEVSRLRRLDNEKEKLIASLKKKIVDFENEELVYMEDRAKLAKLYEIGLIDSSGDPILAHPDDDPDEMK